MELRAVASQVAKGVRASPTRTAPLQSAPKASAWAPTIKAAAPGLKPKDFTPLDSLFGSGAGEVNGTFFVSVKGGKPHLRVPIIFTGMNRLTPEYHARVIKPLEEAIVQNGRTVESLLDGTDFRPGAAELTPAFAKNYIQTVSNELTRVFEEMGVTTEVAVQTRDIPLTAFEQRMLAGGKLTKADQANPEGRLAELQWFNKGKKYRDPNTFTFLLQPAPNLMDSYVATEAFNPVLGMPVPGVLHELGHFLFMGRYEGYGDAFSPPGSVMGDVAAHRVAAARGKGVSFSPMERQRILQRIVDAVPEGKDLKPVRARLAELNAQVKAMEANSAVGRLQANGAVLLSPGQRALKLDASFAALLERADRKRPMLVVFDGDGKVSHINAWQKPVKVEGQVMERGYGKFMPNEVGLTDQTSIDGLIAERLGR